MIKPHRLVAPTLCAVFLMAGSVGPAAAQAPGSVPTKVVFSLDFIPLGRHAPWYAALAEGYFKDEGLDVSIIPAQGTAQVIQAVESGTANIGFVDLPSVAIARSNGSKLKMLAINYGKAPYAIFSLSNGANVTQPKQLEGLTLGSGAGSFTPKVLQGFMAQQGLDPSKLQISNIAPPARATMLMAGQVPSIEFFIMSKPGLEAAAKASNAELRTLLLADHGLELYANGVSATEDYISKNPDLIKRFIRAGLKGWKFALENPEKAAADQIKYVPSLKVDGIIAEIKIVGDLAVTDETKKNGLGWFSPEKMKSNLEFIKKYMGVGPVPVSDSNLYVSGFLPATPVMP